MKTTNCLIEKIKFKPELRITTLSAPVNLFLLFSPQTNAVYHAAFEEWASNFTNVKILNDQTTTNEVNATLQQLFLQLIVFLYHPLAQ